MTTGAGTESGGRKRGQKLGFTFSDELVHLVTVGEVAEWSKAAVSKTVVPSGTLGSNPSLSAILAPLGSAAIPKHPPSNPDPVLLEHSGQQRPLTRP